MTLIKDISSLIAIGLFVSSLVYGASLINAVQLAGAVQ